MQFVKAYINNIIITSYIFENYITYLKQAFTCLVEYNIAIKGKKCFISYLSAIILRRRVNSFSLLIIKEKLAIIKKLSFLRIVKDLKIYLSIAK